MADYTTVESVRGSLRISSEADDVLLAELVTRASRLVDDTCGRWFDVREETRCYNAVGPHITGRLLLLDADLLSLTGIVNGDGSAIDPAAVILRPLNWPPYFGISLRHEGGLTWQRGSDPQGAIQVTGNWGYAEQIPEPVTQAVIRLVAGMYRQRDTGASGPALPRDVRDLLSPYIRLRLSAAA